MWAHTLAQFPFRNATVAPGATHELTLAREYRVADDQGDGEAVPEEERIKVYRVRRELQFWVQSERFFHSTAVYRLLSTGFHMHRAVWQAAGAGVGRGGGVSELRRGAEHQAAGLCGRRLYPAAPLHEGRREPVSEG